jgi:hypothetical protein
MIELIAGHRLAAACPATWQNFPPDLEHFLGYFAARSSPPGTADHGGAAAGTASREVAGGVWQWTKFAREARDAERER